MRFLKVTSDFLKADTHFPFDVFLYDSRAKKRVVAFYANKVLNEDKINDILKMITNGGVLQIVYEEKDSFCQMTCTQPESLLNENKFLFDMIRIEQERKKTYSKLTEQNILLKTFFKEDIKFIELINFVKAHIMLYPLSLSTEVSFTTQLVEKVFTRDTRPVCEATLAYSLAKMSKIDDPQSLCALVLASLFKDLGLNQICRDEVFKTAEQDDFYFKHPMLSIYVLSKADFEFSKLCKRLILEHHECVDGSGFPRQKKEDFIHYLSHIIRVTHELFNLVNGRYNQTSYDWNKAFDIIINQREVEGMKNIFPVSIINLISSLKT